MNIQSVWHGELGGARQVVDDEVNEVLLRDLVAHLARGLCVPGLLIAEPFALDALVHLDLVSRVGDAVATQDLAQVLGLVDETLWRLTEREGVVLVRQLGMTARHFDGFEADFIAFLEIGGSNTRNVKAGRSEVRHGQHHDQHNHGYLYVHHFAFLFAVSQIVLQISLDWRSLFLPIECLSSKTELLLFFYIELTSILTSNY